jgi:ABC-type nitrate/sulfonate/bicarbonate transport system ATPase subunit
LLDDVFSGIDSSATEAIARDLFGSMGLLRKMRTTVVFATHSSKTTLHRELLT